MKIHNLVWNAQIGSAYQLRDQFGAGSFDLVFGQGILHHLTFDLQRVYTEVGYVTREGGFALFLEPYSGLKYDRIREKLSWVIPLDKESPDERPLVSSDLAILQKVFKSVEIAYSDLFEKFARRIFKSRKIEGLTVAVDRVLMRIRTLRSFGGMIFIVIKK